MGENNKGNELSNIKNLISNERNQVIDELKKKWGVNELKMTGSVKVSTRTNKKQFKNIRSTSGQRLSYPSGAPIFLTIPGSVTVDINEEYTFWIKLAPNKFREKSENKYLLQIDIDKSIKQFSLAGKSYVNKLRKEYEETKGIPMDTIMGSLKRFSSETNKKPETFIYELIQNADDYPDPNKQTVDIKFTIANDHLVVTHDGFPFKQKNVHAICTIDGGDKEGDINKTGFKGIGFKSLFKFSNLVWINSGDYSFKFDENFFLSKGKNMPWQVIPIWTQPVGIKPGLRKLLDASVSIFIRPKDGEKKLVEIERIFQNIFKKDNRVLLFLRHVKSLEFQGFQGGFKSIIDPNEWVKSDLEAIKVPKEIAERLAKASDDDERIPEKFKGISKSQILFASSTKDGEVVPTENTRLYAYLPTDWDFGFNFLINGDFIPDGSRDRLFDDIEWNLFLMEQAGYKFVEWIEQVLVKTDNTSAYCLIPDLDKLIENERDRSKIIFLEKFKLGFVKASDEKAFLKCNNNKLELLSNVLIDKTGVSAILGTDVFKARFEISKEAIHQDLVGTMWIEKLLREKEYDSLFTWDNIIVNFSRIKQDIISPSANAQFLNLLFEKKKLKAFEDQTIALSSNGELTQFHDLFEQIPENHQNIIAQLGACWIKTDVLSELNEDVKSELKTFEGPSFIQEFIINRLEEVNKNIQSLEASLSLLLLVKEYSSEMPLASFEALKKLNFIDIDGAVVSNFNNRKCYLPHDFLLEVIDLKCFPINQFSILSSGYEEVGLCELLTVNIGVKDYDKSNKGEFLLDNIEKRIDDINSQLNNLDEEQFLNASAFLLELFINSKEFLNDAQKNSLISELSKLKILSKNQSRIEVNECYISGEYTGHTEVEELIEDFKIEVLFISGEYLEKSNVTRVEWKSLFKELGCKSDHLNFIKDTLLPSINKLEQEELIKATKLIYDKKAKLEKELGLIANFPVATRSGIFKSSEVCFNHKMLEVDPLIKNLWIKFPLDREIHERYFDIIGNPWTDFFVSVGAIEPEKDYPINDLIDSIIVANFDDVQHHLEVFNLIYKLYHKELLSKEHLSTLGSFKLLSENDNYVKASKLVLSKAYSPKVDFKSYVEREVCAISDKYLEGEVDSREVKKFLISMGITEDFNVSFFKRVYRQELPDWFVSFVDNKDNYVKSNADTYAHQHYVGNPDLEDSNRGYNLIPHLDLIANIELNTVFWNQIAHSTYFRANAFLKLTYRCAFSRKLQIPGYLEIYLSKFKSIPNMVGELCFATELYSHELHGILREDNLICKFSFKDLFISEQKLEEIIGINSNLDLVGVIKVLQQEESRHFLQQNKILIRLKELIEGGLDEEDVAVIKSFSQNGKLLNQEGDWQLVSSLYRTEEDFELGIYNNPWLLHKDFSFIADIVGVKVLHESDFVFSKEAYSLETSFKKRLMTRLKYIAYIIENENADDREQTLKESIADVSFYQCRRITMAFSNGEVLIEKNDYDHVIHEGNFYFRGRWNGIRAASMFLKLVSLLGLNRATEQLKFREILLMESTNEIIEFIEDLGFEIPDKWEEKPQELEKEENNGAPPVTETHEEIVRNETTSELEEKENIIDKDEANFSKSFKAEVEEFISSLEETEWKEHIPELKNLLDLGLSHSRDKQKAFNLIAKLKLAQQLLVNFDAADTEYNRLDNYIVHSARGVFAFIHPREILLMNEQGLKMALDFGPGKPVRIYDSAEEILGLNINHLLLYQNEKTTQELLEFCSVNRDANKHLLIVDKENSRMRSKEILRILNSDYDGLE